MQATAAAAGQQDRHVIRLVLVAVEQVRAEIGRLLRQHYGVNLPPMSGSLAEVIKKLEQSAFQPELALIPTDTR